MSFHDSKAGECHMGIEKTDDAKRRNKRPGIHYRKSGNFGIG